LTAAVLVNRVLERLVLLAVRVVLLLVLLLLLLLLVFVAGLLVDLLDFLAEAVFVFFAPDVFARCVFCTADALDCSDDKASGEKVSDVNSKAQSVIETLFIRATEHSPDSGRQSKMPAGDDKNPDDSNA